jgi:hypothetical protein
VVAAIAIALRMMFSSSGNPSDKIPQKLPETPKSDGSQLVAAASRSPSARPFRQRDRYAFVG